MPAAFVNQIAASGPTGSANGTGLSGDLPLIDVAPAGTLAILALKESAGTGVVSVTDTQGNLWNVIQGAASTGSRAHIAWSFITSGLTANDTVTFNAESSATWYGNVYVFTVPGTPSVDATSTKAKNSNSTVISATITALAAADELLVAAVSTGASPGTVTFSGNAGIQRRSQTGLGSHIQFASIDDLPDASSVTATCNWTISQNSDLLVVTFTFATPQSGTCVMSASAGMGADGSSTVSAAAAAMSASVMLSSDGAVQTGGTAPMAAVASLSTDGITQSVSSVSLSAAAAMTAASLAITFGAVSMAAAAALSTTGTGTQLGLAVLSATAAMSANGATNVVATVSLGATTSLTGSGTTQGTFSGAASLAAVAGLSTSGSATTAGATSLVASAAMSTSGKVTQVGSATLGATTGLTATGRGTQVGSAAFAAAAALSSAGLSNVLASVSLAAVGGLVDAGTLRSQGSATLVVLAGLGATGTDTPQGAATLSAVASLSTSTLASVTATASLAAISTLSGAGVVTERASATMVAATTLTTTARLIIQGGTASLTAVTGFIWTPQQLGPTAWWDIPRQVAAFGPFADGFPISLLGDQTSGKALTASGTQRPTIVNNGIGGKPSLYFNGDQLLAGPNLPAGAPFSILMVVDGSRGRAERLPPYYRTFESGQSAQAMGAWVSYDGAVFGVSNDFARTGTASVKVAPGAGTAGNDSGVGVAGDTGGMRLGMTAGHTYRFSGWYYIPASAGASAFVQGNGISTAYYRLNNVYHGFNSAPVDPAKLDQWVYFQYDMTIPVGSTEALWRVWNGWNSADLTKAVYFDDLSCLDITPDAVLNTLAVPVYLTTVPYQVGHWTGVTTSLVYYGFYLCEEQGALSTASTSIWTTPGSFMTDQDVPHVLDHISDGTHVGHNAYVDGAQVQRVSTYVGYSGNPGPSSDTGPFVIGGVDTGANGLVGRISEVVVVPRAITAAERSAWHAYVASKYGIASVDATSGVFVTEGGSAALTASASLSVSAVVAYFAQAVLSASAAMTASGGAAPGAAASLAATVSMSVAGVVKSVSSAVLAVQAALTAAGKSTTRASVTLAAATTMTVVGVAQVIAATVLRALGGLSTAGAVSERASAALSSVTSLSTDVQITRFATVMLQAIAELVEQSLVTADGTATLTASGALTDQAAVEVLAAAILHATAELSEQGEVIEQASVHFAAATALVAHAIDTTHGQVSLTASGTLLALAVVRIVTAVSMVADAHLAAGGDVSNNLFSGWGIPLL